MIDTAIIVKLSQDIESLKITVHNLKLQNNSLKEELLKQVKQNNKLIKKMGVK